MTDAFSHFEYGAGIQSGSGLNGRKGSSRIDIGRGAFGPGRGWGPPLEINNIDGRSDILNEFLQEPSPMF